VPRSSPADLHPGSLLVAAPTLLDPNFADTVVLLLDVSDDGALGIVVNRPASMPLGAVLPVWADLVSPPGTLFSGGPVETEGALAVCLRRSEGRRPGLRDVAHGLALLDLDASPEDVGQDLAALRVFAGYAGWGAGQLQDEVARDDWYVVPGTPTDVFRPDPTGLRREVLRRQPGELAWHSTRPFDPETN